MAADRVFAEKLSAAAKHLRCAPAQEAVINACRRLADERCAAIDPTFTPAERLTVLADHCSTHLEVANTDEELDNIVERYARMGELGFATRRQRFDGELLAAILRRRGVAAGERRFVALIDGRGERKAMAFFSKTHEVAHPFLEPQLEFDFRDETQKRDPWEGLVDRVGSEMVFSGAPWDEAVTTMFAGKEGVSVEQVSKVRGQLASEASLTAAVIAAANHAGHAVLAIWAGTECSQRDPDPVLRVLQVTPSAVDGPIHIHRKRRIPPSSPIAHAYSTGRDACGFEDLKDWRDSAGGSLAPRQVWSAARAMRDNVFALVDFGPQGNWGRR
jgi:hypothetical protein